MKSVKELRKKAASRTRKKATVYSTSEARANFAEAIEMVQVDNSIIGFDRYGRPMAALVPVEAVLLLAGRGVDRRKREAIEESAALFVHNLPGLEIEEPKRAKKTAAKKKTAKAAKKKRKSSGKGV